jgi:putative FmdB family regulatory protein
MPTYQYKCPKCKNIWEEYKTIDKRNDVVCFCGEKPRIIISQTQRPVIYEYYSEGLGEYITGPKQKRLIMKSKNLEEA